MVRGAGITEWPLVRGRLLLRNSFPARRQWHVWSRIGPPFPGAWRSGAGGARGLGRGGARDAVGAGVEVAAVALHQPPLRQGGAAVPAHVAGGLVEDVAGVEPLHADEGGHGAVPHPRQPREQQRAPPGQPAGGPRGVEAPALLDPEAEGVDEQLAGDLPHRGA